MNYSLIKYLTAYCLLLITINLKAVSGPSGIKHPCLILQKSDIPEIVEGLKKFPILESSFEEARTFADEAIQRGIIVPVPKDPAGGFTHEQHTYNYVAMYKAAQVYQLTGDKNTQFLCVICF